GARAVHRGPDRAGRAGRSRRGRRRPRSGRDRELRALRYRPPAPGHGTRRKWTDHRAERSGSRTDPGRGSVVAPYAGLRVPRPGPWRITLESPPTKPGAAPVTSEFSLSARVLGGAVLQARARPLAPRRGSPVTLTAGLAHPDAALTEVSMKAVIRRPDGRSE